MADGFAIYAMHLALEEARPMAAAVLASWLKNLVEK